MSEQKEPAEMPDSEAFSPEGSSARMEKYLKREDEGGAQDTEARAYLRALEARVEDEVAKLRAQGKYPPSLTRRVRTYYRTLLPDGAAVGGRDFDSVFSTVDRVAYMDVDVPTASSKPGVSFLKRSLRSLMAWYLNYLAQQFNNFATNLVHLLGIADARLSLLETRVEAEAFRPVDLLAETASTKAMSASAERVETLLANVSGRVLVTECGDGALLEQLAKAGQNAYGTESRLAMLELAEKRQVELRESGTLEHLASVGANSLGALVMSGIVDRESVAVRISALAQARRILGNEGSLILVCSSNEAFMSEKNRVEADLSPGRPLAPATWEFLLARLGFEAVSSEELAGGDAFLVRAQAPAGEGEPKSLMNSRFIQAALAPPRERRR